MRIVRFEDENGLVVQGVDQGGGKAALIEGDLFEGSLCERLFERMEISRRHARIGRLHCPIMRPSAIFGIGLNYRSHAEETGQPIPEQPVVFMKNPASAHSPGMPILLPSGTVERPEVDYEGELAVIIGRAARNVPAVEASGYIFGYTAANDVSARRWQKHAGGGQWVRGKSFDTFCPLGPCIVTADELGDPRSLRLRTLLNGRVMQDASTSDMIFSVYELVEFLSRDTTLLPGTVILTGTPGGVGFTRNPRVFLRPKDTVAVELERVGSLVNPVEAACPEEKAPPLEE